MTAIDYFFIAIFIIAIAGYCFLMYCLFKPRIDDIKRREKEIEIRKKKLGL